MKRLILSDKWSEHPKVAEQFLDGMSQNQKDLLTPILISSSNIDGIRRAFLEFYSKTNSLLTPLSFRYSFSVSLSGKRSVTIIPKYHLERDLNKLLDDYKILTKIDHIVPTGAAWEEETYQLLKYFKLPCQKAVHKLITTEYDGLYYGYEFKEIFKDKPVK